VTVEARGDGTVRARVAGGSGDYLVEFGPEGASCTCRWFAAHAGSRGPCRHVLAVRALDLQ
jgi:predicted nucleic acid-binding Zn finger protein